MEEAHPRGRHQNAGGVEATEGPPAATSDSQGVAWDPGCGGLTRCLTWEGRGRGAPGRRCEHLLDPKVKVGADCGAGVFTGVKRPSSGRCGDSDLCTRHSLSGDGCQVHRTEG